MSTVIVAIAKFEQDYIEEWVIYHLALGFDKIYFELYTYILISIFKWDLYESRLL